MADTDVKPAFSLVEEASGRWKIGLVNFQRFEEVLKHASTRSGGCVDIYPGSRDDDHRSAATAEPSRPPTDSLTVRQAHRRVTPVAVDSVER